MGTRHIVGTILNDQLHGSYAQFDGYPTGTGANLQAEIYAFTVDQPHAGANITLIQRLLDIESAWPKIADLVSRMRYVNPSDEPTAEEAEKFKDLADGTVSTGRDWYATLRQNQGSLIKPLTAGIATDQPDFIKDSLFCEWGYIFDCDERKVHILKGFNTDPAKQWPRAALTAEEAQEEIDKSIKLEFGPYYGCSLLWSGTLAEFIALDMKTLEESTEEAESEDA